MATPPQPPTKPVCVDEFEELAKAKLPKSTFDYYFSGSVDHVTLADNTQIFRKLKLRPRFLRNVTHIDPSVQVFGKKMDSPIMIAPSAMQKMAHPDGENGTSAAASYFNTVMTLSTYSTTSIEEAIATGRKAAKDRGDYWLQLYVYRDRKISEDLVRRAEACGYTAIVLTIDTPYLGKRFNDLRNKFKLQPPLRLANFDESLGIQTQSERTAQNHNTKTRSIGEVEKEAGKKMTFNELLGTTSDTSLCWEKDIAWLRRITSLKIILKGILTAEDAMLAVRYGVDGIIVSNHGGRQLDTVPPTLLALPEVVDAVKTECARVHPNPIPPIPVFLDGGVRRGTDVLKALALGATAVFIGRPVLYGLAYDGENGVKEVLNILNDEFKLAMALSGARNVNEIDRNCVKWEQEYYARL